MSPRSIEHPRRTVVIENVAPTVDGGRYPVKREVGGVLEVTADIFQEGHDVLVAFLKYRRVDERGWRETPMRHVDNDRWAGAFTLDANARWVFTLEALPEPFRSWLACSSRSIVTSLKPRAGTLAIRSRLTSSFGFKSTLR